MTARQELLERFRLGDRAALEEILRTERGAVYAFFRTRLADATEATRLTEDVFVDLYRHRARLPRDVSVADWLINAARLHLGRYLRASGSDPQSWAELCEDLDGTTLEPVNAATSGRLLNCLEALPPAAREALELHYRSGLDVKRVAERLHRSESATRQLIAQARQSLQVYMNGTDPGPSKT